MATMFHNVIVCVHSVHAPTSHDDQGSPNFKGMGQSTLLVGGAPMQIHGKPYLKTYAI